MNKKSISALQFKRYIVKYVSFQYNDEFVGTDHQEIKLDFDADMQVNEKKDEMKVELSAIIGEMGQNRKSPFEMKVCICGFFEMENISEDIRVYKANAIAILFPYLRAIVSTYTASANINPVILPTMNINAYLDQKENNNMID